MDIIFYTDRVEDGRACLGPEEMRHAVTVLRRKVGDEITFTDGLGTLYTGTLTDIGRREAWIEITTQVIDPLPVCRVHIALAPTKSFDRMAWSLEKLTEIGVSSVIPMFCQRSERHKWNRDRAEKVLISAMKQSRRTRIPECPEPLAFSDVVQQFSNCAHKYLAYLDDESVSLARHYQRAHDVVVLIGPEGDFTAGEVREARDAGFLPVILGDYRLRTETAAVVAAVTLLTLNNKR